MTLAPIDTTSELAVSDYLTKARDWLATCVEMTGPEQIAAKKAEIATAAEATKQLGLSKEIQDDAQEMVRRAEYALGKAIRKGQEAGLVRTIGDDSRTDLVDRNNYVPKASPYDFASKNEMHGNGAGIADLADADVQEFEAALTAARAEGNLSRANVSRKVKGEPPARYIKAPERAAQIEALAERGATSAQIAKQLDLNAEYVRKVAREHDIEITADVVRGKSRRRDHLQMLDNAVEAVEVAAITLRDIDPAELDEDEALERLDSLTASISALSKATKKIKESFRG